MHKLMRYYNQNKKKIWGIVGIIVFLLIILQLLNYFAKKNNEANLNNTANAEQNNSIVLNNSVLSSDKSAVDDETLSEEKINSEVTVIDQFIAYCNNKELENAYAMLTDECKEKLFSSLEEFENLYYNEIFNGEQKTCEIENWTNSIYMVYFLEDALATGKSNDGLNTQDYITVKKVDDEYKLNINNYVGYTELNKVAEQKNIKIEVLNKDIYMEYEEYTIKVTNNNEESIILDTLYDAETLYLEDKNESHYPMYNNEMTEAMLTVERGQTKEIKIKFYSRYISSKEIKKIVFSNLIILTPPNADVANFEIDI